ncbi:MAG: LEPR-XLL domain-containing protein, partial [Burkholderiales bacterium]|nr:LEPR-XLL domain-containing protein [Burkholderiales bacterium]
MLFEALEPRLLLSADPLPGVLEAPHQADIHAEALHQMLDPASTAARPVPQWIRVDLDGASGVRYDGPVQVDGIDIPAFEAPDALEGQEAAIIAALQDALAQWGAGFGVTFGFDTPTDGRDHSVIHVGGDGAAFAQWGPFEGLAEQVDTGNLDPDDIGFVFSDVLRADGLDAEAYGRLLADRVAHEAGHLLGFEHEHEVGDPSNPLAAVAWKPYTHVEIAQDVRNDLLAADGPNGLVGDLTIDGREYVLHPKLYEAVRDHAAYYYAGTVGPDGFPDLLMGQSVIHPEMTGTWLTRVLDMAWAAQDDWSYSAVEKSQILAWAYGMATHAAGDHWAHNLVNEFAEGVFPAVGDIVESLTTEQRELANFLRHFLVEGYLGDATPGYDNNPDRTTLPDGDVSDDSTPGIEYAAPTRFIYEALIRPMANDPTLLTSTATSELIGSSPLVSIRVAGNQFIRIDAGGDFLKDGFELDADRNLWINTSGFANAANNGRFRVLAVTATAITVDVPAGQLVTEAATGNERIVETVPDTGITSIAVDLTANAFVRTSGSFLADGFSQGHRFAASGFVGNAATYTVLEVTATTLKVVERLAAGDSLASGDERLMVQGKRGPALDQFFKLRAELVKKVADLEQPRKDWATLAEDLALKLITGSAISEDFREQAFAAYLYEWIDSIDAGIEAWPDFGLAVTNALFDPQARRDLQNKLGESRGSETDQARIDIEDGVGLVDVIFDQLDYPNGGEDPSDSFINNHLLPMLGVPPALAEVREALQRFGTFVDDLLEPLDDLLNPIREVAADVGEFAKELVKDQIRKKLQIDVDMFEFLSDTGSKMDLASINIGGTEIPIFKPGDRERLDAMMNIPGATAHTPAPDDLGDASIYTFYPDVQGPLREGITFDKENFAAYRNSVVLSKMLLLVEDPMDGETTGAGGISDLFSDILTEQNGGTAVDYDALLLNLNGAHGGNIMTMTLPGVADGEPWLVSVDGDHGWRIDSMTTVSGLYRVNTTAGGAAEWVASVVPGRSYGVDVSWAANVTQLVDNRGDPSQPDQSILPASQARYRIYDGATLVATVMRDQLLAPDYDQSGAVAYSRLGNIPIASGTLRIVLDNAGSDGNIIAGPARLIPLSGGAPQPIQLIRDPVSGAIVPGGGFSTTGSGWVDLVYDTGTGNYPLWESQRLRSVFRELFVDSQNGGLEFPDLGDAPSPDPNDTPIPTDPLPTHATSHSSLPTFPREIRFDTGISVDPIDVTLRVVDGGVGAAPMLQLVRTSDGSLLGEQVLDQNVKVSVIGAAAADTLRVDLSYDDSDDAFTTPVSVFIDFEGGLDIPFVTEDRIIVTGVGPDLPLLGGLFIDSTDRIDIDADLQAQGDIRITAGGVIDIGSGSSLVGGGVWLRSSKETEGGILVTDILADAITGIVVDNATITGGVVSLVAESIIEVDSESIDLLDGQVKIAVVQGTSTATVDVTGASTITASADLWIASRTDVRVRAIAAPDDTSGDENRDAAVAISIIQSSAKTRIGGSAVLSAAGDLDIRAFQKADVIASADGTQGEDAEGASGGTLALNVLIGDIEASVSGSARLSGNRVNVIANSDRQMETFAKSTQGGAADDGEPENTEVEKRLKEYDVKAMGKPEADGGGDAGGESSSSDITFAAAVAIADAAGQALASVTTSGSIRATVSLDVNAEIVQRDPRTADRFTTVADASATVKEQDENGEAETGVGIAVAVNVGDSAARAVVGGGVRLEAPAIRVESHLVTPSRFGAQATSGAGASDTGVAGSFAVNVGAMRSEATVATDVTIIGGGSFTLRARSDTTNTAKALPHEAASGESLGIGASVAVNVADTVTRAEIMDGAFVNGALGALTVNARATSAVATEARSGAEGGTAIAPAAAIVVVNEDTIARVGAGAQIQAASLDVTAARDGTSTAHAEGDAEGSEDAAVGAAFALNAVSDRTEASVDRSLALAGAAVVLADGRQTTKTVTKAGAKGGEKDDDQDGGDDDGVDQKIAGQRNLGDSIASGKGARTSESAGDTPTASVANTDSEGEGSSETISVAGAITVNVGFSRTHASIGAGVTVGAGGDVGVRSISDVDVEGSADGSAVSKDGSGVGAAVVVSYTEIDNTATIGGGATVRADNLIVEAGMAGADPAHRSFATTKSGAGAKEVGVAGSVSINLLDVDTTAEVGATTALDLDGDLTVRAVAHTETKTEALPENEDGAAGSGDDVGVGASVAFDRSDAQTRATVHDGTSIDGDVRHVGVEAVASHDKTVTAENGAKGETGVGASAAIALANNGTEARLGTGPGVSTTGNVVVRAIHDETVINTAKAEAAGSDTAVGASVGVTVITDTVAATVARNVAAAGDVTVQSESRIASTVDAQASASGNSKEGRDADAEADNQVNNNPNKGSDKALPKAQDGVDQGNETSQSESSTESGSVGVGASVAVNWIVASNTASIGDGVTVSAGEDLAVRTVTDTDASTKATGTAINLDAETAVGAAVGLTVADSTSRAFIGAGASVAADSVAIEALSPAGQRDEIVTWGLAAGGGSDTGAAGSAAVTILLIDREAVTGVGSAVTASTGNVTIRADHTLGLQGIAAAAGFGQDETGVGVAVVVNIVDRDTVAAVGDGASVDAAGVLTISATSALQRVAVDAPLLPDEADPGVTAVAVSGGMTTGDTAIGGSAVINVLLLDTDAHIGIGADINQNLAGGASQDVVLHATDATAITNIAGAIGAGQGDTGVGIGLDVTYVNKDVRAYVGRSARVDAGGDLELLSDSDENVVSVASSLGLAGGSAGVGGSVSVQIFTTQSRAYVDGASGAGAVVEAGGGVSVAAHGDFDAKIVAGTAAYGGDAGVGVANTTLVHTDTVEAFVGQQAAVTARGASGVDVHADSRETLVTVAAGGAGSSSVAVAGSAVVNILNETTRA